LWTGVVAAGLLSQTVDAAVLRDTLTDDVWQQMPAWRVEAYRAANFRAYPAVAYRGDGQRLESISFIASFLDPFDVPNPDLDGDVIDLSVGVFGSLADWQSDPTRTSLGFDEPSNADWRVPVAMVGGVKFHRITLDLSGMSVSTTPGQLQLVSVGMTGVQADPNFPGISGFMHGIRSEVPGDYFAGRGLYEHTGTLLDWTDDVFDPAPSHVAALVRSIPEPMGGVGALAGLLAVNLVRRSRS
jgi:hypothetical protein